MKKIISLCLSALFATAMLSACNDGGGGGTNSDGSISLKFNFQKGSRYKYIMKNHQSITQDIMGKSMTVGQDMDMESTYQVAGADGNNKKLTVTYDRIAMKSDNSAMKMAYDSDDSAHNDPMFKSLGNMVHKSFSMTVNDKGQIVALEGFENLMPNAGGNMPISDSSLRSMMQQSFYIYPDKPVKPGDTWSNNYSTSLGFMDLNTDNTFKLVSVSNGIAHVEMNSKISSRPSSNADMKDVKMELSGVQTGAIDIEIATGLMMGSTLNQQIKGTMDMREMKAPIQVNSDISIVGAREK